MQQALYLFRRYSVTVALPILLLIVAGLFRFVSLKKNGELYDEQITRAVVNNIWRGDFRNNWQYVPNIPEAHRLHCYNFSSYFYVDALFAPPSAKQPLFRDRTFSATCGTLSLAVFYLVALSLFGQYEALTLLALLTIFPLLVQDAHYGRPEAFATLLCGLVYACCAGILARKKLTALLAGSSALCGLLIACKISFIPLVSVPLICALARSANRMRLTILWAALVLAGAFAGMPDAFSHPRDFMSGVEMLRHQYANEHVPHSLPDATTCWRLLGPYFLQTAGVAFPLLTAVGIAVLLKKKQYLLCLVAGAPVIFYTAFFGQQRVFFERNLSHVIPLAAMLAGVGLVALVKLVPHRKWRPIVFAAALSVVVIQPALVSKTLVLKAMRTTTEWRALQYGKGLSRREGIPLVGGTELLIPGHVAELENWTKQSASDILVETNDYHDPYTNRAAEALRMRMRAKAVGHFPSFFPDFVPSTLLVYHSPSLRYLRLGRGDSYTYRGQPFVSWKMVGDVVEPQTMHAQSWKEDAIPREAPPLQSGGRVFGSFTPFGGDGNRGSIQMKQIELHGETAIAIPLMTGPKQEGLSIEVVNSKTGRTLTKLDPVPPLFWAIWCVELKENAPASVDITARDESTTRGAWLALGFPMRLSENAR